MTIPVLLWSPTGGKIVRFMYNNLIDTATATANSAATDFPVTNLQHEWFKKEWRSTGVASEWVKFDLGSAQNVAALVVKYHNFTGAATVHIQANATDAWGAPSVDVALPVTSDLIVYFWSAAQSYRWWRLTIVDAGNTDGYVRIGRIFLGTYFAPSRNCDNAYEIEPSDPSVTGMSTGGQVSADSRTHFRQWIFDFRGLTAADRTSFEAVFTIVGKETKPYFLSEYPDIGSTMIYYVRNVTNWRYKQMGGEGLFALQINIREER